MLSGSEPTVHTPDDAAASAETATARAAAEKVRTLPPPETTRKPRAKGRVPLLRRADQAVVAAVVAASLVAVATYWYMRGGTSGRLVEIEVDGVDLPRAPLVADFTVDLNSADWMELDALPNVGERLARRIVESRKTDGPFRSVDDLDRVPGIGARTVERLRPYLRVSKVTEEPPGRGGPQSAGGE